MTEPECADSPDGTHNPEPAEITVRKGGEDHFVVALVCTWCGSRAVRPK